MNTLPEIKDQALNNYVKRLETSNTELGLKSAQASNAQRAAQLSMFEGNQGDIIRWQLDLSEELERIEHILRGHVLKRTKEGDEIWVPPTSIKYVSDENGSIKKNPDGTFVFIEEIDESRVPFNEYGVQLLMGFISFYINKNTLMSNYDEDTIKNKMWLLGNELNDLIYMKYEEMGLNTAEKKRLYFMIVREICDSIHSAYMRAFGGEERNSLRKVINYSQVDNNSGRQILPSGFDKRKIGFWQSLMNAPV